MRVTPDHGARLVARALSPDFPFDLERSCGKSIRHRLLGLLRQAVHGRIAGYEDVNDAERLARDPAMRAIVAQEGIGRSAASTSEMGRLKTG